MILQTECCICGLRRDEGTGNWYLPTPEEKRDSRFKKGIRISHGYCPICIELLTEEGTNAEKI